MKIKFIGAVGGEVTGSCTLCCARNGTRFLVDCGAFQGGHLGKNSRFPFDPKSIDFVLLTHAHLDHCGRIPDLVECGFIGKIYCKKVTRDLAILNLLDAQTHRGDLMDMLSYMLPRDGRGQQELHGWKRKQQECAQADDSRKKLYKFRGEVRARLEQLWKDRFTTEDEKPNMREAGTVRLDNDLTMAMIRSSHFLGAVSFTVSWDYPADGADDKALADDTDGKASGKTESGKTICFSGDLGSAIDLIDGEEENHLSLLKDGHVSWENTDYFVMESTYGGKVRDAEQHKDFGKRIERLRELVLDKDTDQLVFACFSMQRTQDILFDLVYLALQEQGQAFEIVLDSGMAIRACQIYKDALTQTLPQKDGGEKLAYFNDKFVERFEPLLGEGYLSDEGKASDRDAAKIQLAQKFLSEVLDGEFQRDNLRLVFRKGGEEDESESDAVVQGWKRIHITSSGMLQDGPIRHHLFRHHGDKRTAFVITGFCASTENGKTLADWEENGKTLADWEKYGGSGSITCNDKPEGESEVAIKRVERKDWEAQIHNVARYYSGHADEGDLLRFLFRSSKYGEGKKTVAEKKQKHVTVFLNHGNAGSRVALKAKVEEESRKPENQAIRRIKSALLPNATDAFFDLDTGEWVHASEMLAPVYLVPSKREKEEESYLPDPPARRKPRSSSQRKGRGNVPPKGSVSIPECAEKLQRTEGEVIEALQAFQTELRLPFVNERTWVSARAQRRLAAYFKDQ